MNTGELIWSDEGWPGPDFAHNARRAVENSQLRRNVRKATTTIRERRAGLVAETPTGSNSDMPAPRSRTTSCTTSTSTSSGSSGMPPRVAPTSTGRVTPTKRHKS